MVDIREPSPRKPDWIRVRLPSGETWKEVDRVLAARQLRTVCDEARCPNKGECWGAGTATFMILGDVCTRSCRFCAVNSARKGQPPRAGEGAAIARAAKDLGLRYVVLTSVDRDDLPDHGAGHFAAVIRAIKEGIPGIGVEALIPDYTGDELRDILAAGAEVIAHNVETVPSLQWVRDRRASFERSLTTLRELKAAAGKGAPLTKTSLLLGLGEKPEEVLAVMDELRDAGVDILVMGQYLRPSKKQIPVAEYISPDQFARYAGEGRNRGFLRVISSPFARTSYHAREAWEFRKSQGGRVRIETLGKPPGSKLIRLSAELEGDLIKTIRIRGDFFASPEESFDRLEMRLAGTSLAGLAASFDSLLREEGIEAFGITGAGVASVLATAVLTAAVPAAAVSEKTEEARGSSL